MSKALTIQNLYSKRFETLQMDGDWAEVFGQSPEANGVWLIWGKEKNGKTQLALKLADYLSQLTNVLYISAEEGAGLTFVENCRRAKINTKNKNLRFWEYTPIAEIFARLSKRRSEDVIVIDNITVYNDELKNGVLKELLKKYPKKLFIFIAHEDRNEPYTSTAKLIQKLAKVIMYVEGLSCRVGGRVPGGELLIDENKAKIFHGEQIINN